jgi:hypothetical protein
MPCWQILQQLMDLHSCAHVIDASNAGATMPPPQQQQQQQHQRNQQQQGQAVEPLLVPPAW